MADRKIRYRHNGTVTFDKNVARRINIYIDTQRYTQYHNINYANSTKMGPEDIVGWGIRLTCKREWRTRYKLCNEGGFVVSRCCVVIVIM